MDPDDRYSSVAELLSAARMCYEKRSSPVSIKLILSALAAVAAIILFAVISDNSSDKQLSGSGVTESGSDSETELNQSQKKLSDGQLLTLGGYRFYVPSEWEKYNNSYYAEKGEGITVINAEFRDDIPIREDNVKTQK